jgi:hypothetical protein
VPIITLTTDFGGGSSYVAAMKGVVLAINPAARLIDLTHDVRPQDVRQGAVVLDQVTRFFPAGTIHVAVIDPGVGTDRKIVYAAIGSQQYIAPDNGLLSLLAGRTPPSAIVAVADPSYWLSPVSATFHGRDIMAPVAARLSLGLDPEKLGPPLSKLVELAWPEPRLWPGRIEGEVLDVDSFGNLISNVTSDLLAAVPPNAAIRVACGGREVPGLASTYGKHPRSSLIALVGSSGMLELAVVDGSAARLLDAGVGAPVTVVWK